MAKTSVTENSRNRRPTMPPMNSSGMNAAISDTEIDTTVKPICLAPSMVARSGEWPFSRLRNTFSIITIASSTTKPMHTASAISDRLSIENPASHIAAQVPASDSGTVMPAAMVAAVPVSYTHLRAHETDSYLVCRLLLEKNGDHLDLHLSIRRQRQMCIRDSGQPHRRAGTGERQRHRDAGGNGRCGACLLYTSPSPRDGLLSRMPSSA